MKRLTVICALLIVCIGSVSGQPAAPHDSVADAWPLTSVYYVEAGGERAFNTYLSPLRQTGPTFALGGEWGRGCSTPRRRLSMFFSARYRMGFLENPARNASVTDLCLSLGWNMQRTFTPFSGVPELNVSAGAGAAVDGGLLYLPGNSNNPVAARLYAGLTLNGTATYSIRAGRTSLRLIDQVSLPSAGVFFSPHYGQSYYEIYLGEHDGLARFGWWGNHFCIDNLVAVEIPVCSTRIRAGYRFQVLNSRAHGIDSRITTHSFVLGIATDWLNITRR